jgi:hypothetical protein
MQPKETYNSSAILDTHVYYQNQPEKDFTCHKILSLNKMGN